MIFYEYQFGIDIHRRLEARSESKNLELENREYHLAECRDHNLIIVEVKFFYRI